MAGPSRDSHDRVPDEFELKGDPIRPDPPADPEHPIEDGMHPPTVPILVHCIHCGEEYDSWRIEWRVVPDADGRPHGFWCCPTPGCDGAGFGMDIWPVDFPEDGTWTDPDGRELHIVWDDDDEESDDEDWDEDEFDDSLDDDLPGTGLNGHFDDDDIPF